MKKNEKILKVLKHVVLVLGAIVMLVPFAWMILTAFKTNSEAMQINPFVIFPEVWRTESIVCKYADHDRTSNPLRSTHGYDGRICIWKIEVPGKRFLFCACTVSDDGAWTDFYYPTIFNGK